MFAKTLNIFLYYHFNCHKFRRKFLMQIISSSRNYNSTLQNVRHCSTDSISTSLDKKILQKYFNYVQSDISNLSNIISPDCDQYQTALDLLEKKKKLEKELKILESLKNEGNEEIENLIKKEEKIYEENISVVENDFLQVVVPPDNLKNCSEVELQVIPAIGGNEAKLFAEELHSMYVNYALYKNWKILLAELRGNKFELRSAFLLVSSDSALKYLIQEAGIHRVQRIPETEKTGRTHTSTCCVSVTPKTNLGEIIIKPNEVTVERVRSSGPGGQNVNKRETCIQLTHIPTGIKVESQKTRSQSENLEDAYNKLRAILRENSEKKVVSEKSSLAKEQIKTGDYSDKIRTYHFSQNRITDHRINFSLHNIKEFLLGNKSLDLMISKVAEFKERDRLIQHVTKVLDSTEYKKFEKSQSL